MTDNRHALFDALEIDTVELRVTDLGKAVAVWGDIVGLAVIARSDGRAVLGAGGRPLIELSATAGQAAPPKSVGLFHVALHVPTRRDLAHAAARLRESGRPHSAQDHLVSESLYISDADGNGIEICLSTPERGRVVTDAPKPYMLGADGSAHSGLEPLDLEVLLAELKGQPASRTLPEGMFVGHIHMRSNEPERAMAFYTGMLGFRPHVASAVLGLFDCGTANRRHLIAFNTWGGRNLPAAPEDAAGLSSYSFALPEAALRMIETELADCGVPLDRESGGVTCHDPDGNLIRFRTREAEVGG